MGAPTVLLNTTYLGKKSNCVLLACKNTQEAALSTQTFVFVNSEERLARVCAHTELGE